MKIKKLNEAIEPQNTMKIMPLSGLNADGFTVIVLDSEGNEIFNKEYRYGVNASYDRKFAKWAEDDYNNAKKYGWKTPRALKPYVADIIDELCSKYGIDKNSIDFVAGKNIFSGGNVTDDFVSRMKQRVYESKSMNENWSVLEFFTMLGRSTVIGDYARVLINELDDSSIRILDYYQTAKYCDFVVDQHGDTVKYRVHQGGEVTIKESKPVTSKKAKLAEGVNDPDEVLDFRRNIEAAESAEEIEELIISLSDGVAEDVIRTEFNLHRDADLEEIKDAVLCELDLYLDDNAWLGESKKMNEGGSEYTMTLEVTKVLQEIARLYKFFDYKKDVAKVKFPQSAIRQLNIFSKWYLDEANSTKPNTRELKNFAIQIANIVRTRSVVNESKTVKTLGARGRKLEEDNKPSEEQIARVKELVDDFKAYNGDPNDTESFSEWLKQFGGFTNKGTNDILRVWKYIKQPQLNEASYDGPYGAYDVKRLISGKGPQDWWVLKEIEMDFGDGAKVASYLKKKGIKVEFNADDETWFVRGQYHFTDCYFYPYAYGHEDEESLTEGTRPSQSTLDDCLEYYLNNAFGYDGVEDYVDTEFPHHDNAFKAEVVNYIKERKHLDEDATQYGVHQFSTDSIIFRGTEQECGEYIDNNQKLWDDAEVYRMEPGDPHYKKMTEASCGETITENAQGEGKYSDTFHQYLEWLLDEGKEDNIGYLASQLIRYCPEEDLKDLWHDRMEKVARTVGYTDAEDQHVVTEGLDDAMKLKAELQTALRNKGLKLNPEQGTVDDAVEYIMSSGGEITVDEWIKETQNNYPEYFKESLTEDVEVPTLTGPEEGPKSGVAALINEAIQEELKTVQMYNDIAVTARAEGFTAIAGQIDEINTEENKHIGQLQEVLKTVAPNAQAIDAGELEAGDTIINVEEGTNNSNNTPNNNIEEDVIMKKERWEDIYNSFKAVEKELNQDGEAVTAVVDKMYQDNKDDPDYKKAYDKWASGE